MSETSGAKKGGIPVSVYLAIIFAGAFLILLSIFCIQQRNYKTSELGFDNSSSVSESLGELTEENQALRKENEDLKQRVDELSEKLDATEQQLETCEDWLNEYIDRSGAAMTLYAAELKYLDEDYEGAAKELLDWDAKALAQAITVSDAKMEHYHPTGLLLKPRYDFLVEDLTGRGLLE